jgi:hypothetical protein
LEGAKLASFFLLTAVFEKNYIPKKKKAPALKAEAYQTQSKKYYCAGIT